MRFSIVSVLAFVASAVAQGTANSFNLPDGTLVFQAGQAKQLTWDNKAGNTVTLKLRTGDRSDLKDVSTIASNIANTGSYTWTPPANTPEGSNYAIEIINDDDTSQINYTNQFVIQSDVKAVASGSSTGAVTATSASLVTSMPTAPATGSSSGSSGSATASGSASGSASGMTTRTGSASASASASGSSTGSSSRSGASSTSAAGASVPTNNAAAKPVVGAAGGLLAVAVGFAVAL